MKAIRVLLVTGVLAALGLAAHTAWGERPGPVYVRPLSAEPVPDDSQRFPPPPPLMPPPLIPEQGEEVVTKLIALLDEADSPDTLLATVLVLQQFGPEARPALPAILRNATRLGMLKGLTKKQPPAAAQAIVTAAQAIAGGSPAVVGVNVCTSY